MTKFTLLGTVLLLAEPALRAVLAILLLLGRRSARARGIGRAVSIALTVVALVLLAIVGAGASRLMAGSLGSIEVLVIAIMLAAAVLLLYAPAIWLLLRALGPAAWRLRLGSPGGEAGVVAVAEPAMYAAALCLVLGSAIVWLVVGMAALLV